MLTVQINDKAFQYISSASQTSTETVNETLGKSEKIQRKQLAYNKELIKLIKKMPYPNFRFFCPYCASLDIFITLDKTKDSHFVDCLECKKRWIDVKRYKT